MSRRASVPREFEDLLTPAGRRILSGRVELCGALADPRRRFLALDGMVAKAKAEALRRVLEEHLLPLLTPMSDPIDCAFFPEMAPSGKHFGHPGHALGRSFKGRTQCIPNCQPNQRSGCPQVSRYKFHQKGICAS